MKILFIINTLSLGGAEKLLSESIPFYEEKGYSVDLVVLSRDVNQFLWKELARKSSVSVLGLTAGSIYNPMLILKLIPFVKKHKIIHIHLFPALYWVVLSKFFCNSNADLIFTEHSTENRRRNNIVLKMLDRIIYRALTTIICITDATKTHLTNHLGESSKLETIENGVNREKFSTAEPASRTDYSVSENDFLLIQVASFRDAKDQDTVIKAMEMLPSNIKVIFVGKGPRLQHCKDLAAQLEVSSRTIFLGSRDDVPNLLKMSDVCVMSSNYEGFGLAAVEAMAAGKPVIASDVEGLASVVSGAGLLFRLKDHLQLSNIILKLMTQKEFYNKVALRCEERAKQFDIREMVKNYISVYKRLGQKKV